MIVLGGTGSGKTTLLNMLSSYIPDNELIITVEDSCELNLHQPNVRRMEARISSATGHGERLNDVTIQDLVRNALRMRPDRLIVGEIRDHTVVDMMSAMSTGHEGSMSTVHANSPRNLVVSRLPILYGMSRQMTFSENAQAIQITEALQLLVQIQRLRNGKRVITHITEVTGLDKDYNVILNDIFEYDEEKNVHRATGYVPKKLLDKLKVKGIDIWDDFFTAGTGEEGAQ
jgi:Flp pilus assembly CpaF family ATPase